MKLRRWFAPLAAALGLVVAGCASVPLDGEDDESGEAERPLLRGVTVTTPQDPEATIAAISAFDPEPTVRLVLDLDPALTGGTDEDRGSDRGVGLGQYRRLIEGLNPHARLMVQVVDSTELARLSAGDIEQRTRALVDAFGESVDIWEVGNEINGAWAGSGPAEIIEKTAAAARVVEDADGATAITFNYWSSPDCYSQPWEDASSFARALPDDVLANLDYLFLSVYETACDPPQYPSAEDLAEALTELGRAAPEASLGIGEIGVAGVENDFSPAPLAEKQAVARRYMRMSGQLREILGDRFVDGWFWWYFVEDAVMAPAEESLWPTLDELLRGL